MLILIAIIMFVGADIIGAVENAANWENEQKERRHREIMTSMRDPSKELQLRKERRRIRRMLRDKEGNEAAEEIIEEIEG